MDSTMLVEVAKGFRVDINRLFIEQRRLIYLSMLGDRTSLDATWAYIKNRPRRLIDIGQHTIKTEKQEHFLFKSRELPCGAHHWIMVNRRASWKTIKPNEDFYLLDMGRHNYYHNTQKTHHPHFYTLLNTALTIPILPHWSQTLWTKGNRYSFSIQQERKTRSGIQKTTARYYLIDSVDEFADNNEAYNMRGWKVKTNFDAWEHIISDGVRYGELTF